MRGKWKFGDVLRRVREESIGPGQSMVMVIAPLFDGGGYYYAIGLRDEGHRGYSTGQTKNAIQEKYWTLVTDA